MIGVTIEKSKNKKGSWNATIDKIKTTGKKGGINLYNMDKKDILDFISNEMNTYVE
jgi:hypothetical protein